MRLRERGFSVKGIFVLLYCKYTWTPTLERSNRRYFFNNGDDKFAHIFKVYGCFCTLQIVYGLPSIFHFVFLRLPTKHSSVVSGLNNVTGSHIFMFCQVWLLSNMLALINCECDTDTNIKVEVVYIIIRCIYIRIFNLLVFSIIHYDLGQRIHPYIV